MLGAGVATPTGHGFINWVIYGVLQGPKTAWWLVPIVGVVTSSSTISYSDL